MRLINIFSVAMLAINVATASCTSSQNESSTSSDAERTITVTNGYIGLTTGSGIAVNYTASATDGSTICEISGPADIAKCVNAVVRDSTLHIEITERRWLTPVIGMPVTVTIQGRQINDIKAKSGSVLTVRNQLVTSEDFEIEADSGAKIKITGNGGISCKDLSLDLSPGAVMTINNAQVSGLLDIEVSSGGRLTLAGRAATGKVRAASGAKITMDEVSFSGKIKVNAASGAVVTLTAGDADVTKGPGAKVSISR